MSFDYSIPAASQTPYTPAAKPVYCKSFKIDLAAVNAATATAYTLGKLPKDSQIMAVQLATTTAVSGPSVSAATLACAANTFNLVSAYNVFTTGTANSLNSAIATNTYGVSQTADVNLTYTLTLTGGATATAGVIWVNIFYVA